MEDLIQAVLEKSLVGGAFLYLLYYFVTRFNVTLERIAETLNKIDLRFEMLEKRLEKLEEKIHE